MNESIPETRMRRLDLAARAGWLYYIRGRTQDEIATELNLSRQNAQRLVAQAIGEGLIKFRLDHPLVRCIELGQRLKDRFGLALCDVAPSAGGSEPNLAGVAERAGQLIETYLAPKSPQIIAVGTGRAMLESVRQVSSMTRPDHRIVSAVGNLRRDGRASAYDVGMRLADKIGGQCYPIPLPVITDSEGECVILEAQRGYRVVRELFEKANAVFTGVGSMNESAPMFVDGFIDRHELKEMMDKGAVGEICSHAFDTAGEIVETSITPRLTAFALQAAPARPTVFCASGAAKVAPLVAALKGRLANGLITDEWTATAMLERA